MKNTLVLKTFLGPLRLNWSEKGLEHIQIDLNASPTDRPETLPSWLQDFLQELQAYLQAGRPFTQLPPIHSEKWTPFQREIYEQLFATRLGETLTYGELAARCQRPKAARSVGAAMSRNTLPILIPCHRVLPAGGKLGNYTGGEGPLSKEKLLSFEKSFLGAEKGHAGSLT